MIVLPEERAGLYLRALRAGLRVLAPGQDHPPLEHLDAHLHALDPAVSETLLLPAQIDVHTGLPSLSWMDRVRAEQSASEQVRPLDPQRIEAIRDADPALTRRLRGRLQLLAWLRDRPLSREFCAVAEVVRQGEGRHAEGRRVRVTLDRRSPGAGWIRLRVDLNASRNRADMVLRRAAGSAIVLEDGFEDLLARHVMSPLPGVHSILSAGCGLHIHRISRGTLGPFWFPGGPAPRDPPEWVDGALVLHLGLEVIGEDVRTRTHHDPFSRPLIAPDRALGTYRGRRLAVSPHRTEAAEAWCRAGAGVADVVPLVP